MSQYEKLPAEPGVYCVTTHNGTVHIIDTVAGTWERRPSPRSAPFVYDHQKAPLSSLGSGWEVGGLGHLEVADETYLGGGTWHRTSFIASIRDASDPESSDTDSQRAPAHRSETTP
jgi:hypothetical protein